EPFQAQPIFDGLGAGDYELLIVDQMGCMVELTATVGLANSLEDLALFNHLQIFPNPFTADLWLSLELQSSIDLDLTIYNVHGQRLAYQQQRFSTGAHQWRLPVAANWPAGTYFVELRAAQFVEVLRVVKE
ncbi:MAG: T9SS type A sorting domain-containing protein, partial [Phaeodactylibacter sp.]|nr:T9SS type A sorting domain-containing protein [Phaeodactylibacter sp.]